MDYPILLILYFCPLFLKCCSGKDKNTQGNLPDGNEEWYRPRVSKAINIKNSDKITTSPQMITPIRLLLHQGIGFEQLDIQTAFLTHAFRAKPRQNITMQGGRWFAS